MARGLAPGGRIVTLELERAHAEVARATFARAGLADTIDVRVGPALDSLAALSGPFDLIFIDADKRSTPAYFRESLRLSHPGTVIVADNVIRGGRIVDGDDPSAAGMREFVDVLATEPRVSATVIQTVGVKGHDGFALAVVNG